MCIDENNFKGLNKKIHSSILQVESTYRIITEHLLHGMFTTSILQVNVTWATENDSGKKMGLNFYMEHQEWDVTPLLGSKDDYQRFTHVCT